MELANIMREVEAVSAHYAERHDIDRTDDWLVLKLGEEIGELTQAYLARAGQTRDKGRTAEQRDEDFRDELADVLAQILLIAHRFGIDLETAIEHKWLVWHPKANR